LDLTFDQRVLGFQIDAQVQKFMVGANFDHRHAGVLLSQDRLEIRQHDTGPAHILRADRALEEMLFKRRHFSGVKLIEQIAFGQLAIYGSLVVQISPVLSK
jgi:hypothetical protein